MFKKREAIHSILAIAALVIGLFTYLLGRQPETTYFLSHWMVLPNYAALSLGFISNHLPSFVHVYALTLLTVAALPNEATHPQFVCASWFTIESLFELGQHSYLSPLIIKIIPTWFDGIPFLENTVNFFLKGTFDPIDLIWIACGTTVAYLTILLTEQMERKHAVHR